MNSIERIEPTVTQPVKPTRPNHGGGVSFKDTLNALQRQADKSIERVSTGEISNANQVMAAVEDANLAYNLMAEIRGKLSDSYSEVMKMQSVNRGILQ